MLTRSTQVGEFYIMRPPPFPPKKGTRPGFLDILVYDEESDRHIRVSWADALKATCAEFLITQNDASAVSYGNYTMNKANGDPYKFTDWFDEAVALDKLNVTSVPEDDVGYLAFVGAYNTYLECMMVVTRPFIEHLMHSAVVMKAGRETGATLFGPADMRASRPTPDPPPQRSLQTRKSKLSRCVGARNDHRRFHAHTPTRPHTPHLALFVPDRPACHPLIRSLCVAGSLHVRTAQSAPEIAAPARIVHREACAGPGGCQPTRIASVASVTGSTAATHPH